MTGFLVRVPISGTRNGQPWPAPGEVIDLPDSEALEYLNARYIVPVPSETAAAAVTPDPAPRSDGKARAPRPSVKAAEKADAAARKAAEEAAAAEAARAAEEAAAADKAGEQTSAKE